MPNRARWTRHLVGLALCGSFTLTASGSARAAGLDDGELWEQQIREDLRRDILEREEQLWEERDDEAGPARATAGPRAASPPGTSAAAPPAATPPEADRPRRDLPTPFSPLASFAERSRSALASGHAVLPALDARIAIDLGIGLPASAFEPAAVAARLQPDDAAAWQRLARIELETGQPVSAARSLERARSLGPVALGLLARVASAAGEAALPDVATRAPSYPSPPSSPSAVATLGGALERAGRSLDGGSAGRAGGGTSRTPLVAAGVGIALVAALLLLRRRGDLTVQIVYPQELRGSFVVRLDRSQARSERRTPRSDGEVLKGGTSTRREHHLVARETSFRRLLRGRHFVTVDGVLEDPRDGSSVAHPFLQGSATVMHRRTVRLDVDATPGACPIDVKITWDDVEVADAVVAVRGESGGRFETVEGRVRLHLPRGEYRIVAGGGDRVVERPLQVRSHLPTQLAIDLGRSEGLVFKACPPAIEPYLSGQLEEAADKLMRDGQPVAGHRLLGQRCREHGRSDEAALHFEAAGDLVVAAELQSDLGNYAHAGELFERANDLLSAGAMYQLAGQEVRAGRAFEAARDFESAIECYRSSGDVASWVEALDRSGAVFDAAQVALDNGLPTRGVRLLHRISVDDPDHRRACLLLADTFERESHFDLAADNLGKYVAATPEEEIEPAVYSRLAELHEKTGDLGKALTVLENLRMVDPTYPNLATRAEQLRKAQSAKRQLGGHLLDEDTAMAPTVVLESQRYEQLEEIGRGGMGVVYKARDRRLGRIVALKRLSDGLREHPRAVGMFLREARAAAALNHPNIVTVYDADQDDDRLFITMELLDGHPLHRLLRQRGRMSTSEVARIGMNVCDGLEYAHNRGVIHRDIKTANLFLTSDGNTKIMDFGLARFAEEVRRSASLIGGTPYYMAPEQTQGGAVDHRADLYSLGATLFELATGEVPFPDGDAQHHNLHTPPRDPREVAPDLDPSLAALILELLAKDPDQRPQSAAGVGLRLAALAAER